MIARSRTIRKDGATLMNKSKAKKVELMIGGGAVWSLPDCSRLELMWMGPGSGLYLGTPREVGGFVTRINHPTADHVYNTMREAQAAVDAFVNAGTEV